MNPLLHMISIGGCRAFLPAGQNRGAWNPDSSTNRAVTMPMLVPGQLTQCFSPGIDPFEEETSIFVGPKGVGKSALLLLKKTLIEGGVAEVPAQAKDIECLPILRASRSTASELLFSEQKQQGMYSDVSMWEAVWCFLLSLFVIQAGLDRLNASRSIRGSDRDQATPQGRTDSDEPQLSIPEEAKAVIGLQSDDPVAVVDFEQYLKRIIESGTGRRFFDDIYAKVLRQQLLLATTLRRYCVFLDAIDEKLKDGEGQQLLRTAHYRIASGRHADTEVQKDYERSYDIWANAQIALIGVSDRILQDTRHRVKLYTSMRSEAFHSYDGGQALGQLGNTCKEIFYDELRLRNIIALNIYIDTLPEGRSINLNSIESAVDSAVTTFFGAKGYTHVSGQEEEWIKCMIRHSMERPRDLMLIGKEIGIQASPGFSKIPAEQKLELIQKPAARILNDFARFLGVAWNPDLETKVLPQVPSNVLTRSDLNTVSQSVKMETNGDFEHPFCRLFSLGLLGYVKRSDATRQVQLFDYQAINSQGRLDAGLPAEANWFLLHPLLNQKIRSVPQSARKIPYRPVTHQIIGNGYLWVEPSKAPVIDIRQIDGGAEIAIDGIVVFGRDVSSSIVRLGIQDSDVILRAKRFNKANTRGGAILLTAMIGFWRYQTDTLSAAEFMVTLRALMALTPQLVPSFLLREDRKSKGRKGRPPKNAENRNTRDTAVVLAKLWESFSNSDHCMRDINSQLRDLVSGRISLSVETTDNDELQLVGLGISPSQIELEGISGILRIQH